MAASTRIKGNQLALKFGTPAVDYWADATDVVLDNEDADKDVTTFADAAAGGGQQDYIQLTGIQSTSTASLWKYAWANPGLVVPFTYAPHGNAAPSAEQPHFTGTVKIGRRPRIGGKAGETYTFDAKWNIITGPVMVSA